MEKSKKSYVYFIGNSSCTAIKIGMSRNVERRLKQLQTGNPEKLEILYVLEGGRDTEQFYHRYFSEMYNIKGEFYDYAFVKSWIERDKIEKQIQRELGLIQ